MRIIAPASKSTGKDQEIQDPKPSNLWEKTGVSSFTPILVVVVVVFFNLIPEVKAAKAKTIKWHFIKLKSFFTAKETINNMKW